MSNDSPKRPQIEWAMWANEQAVVSAFILMTGSILGIAGMFHNWAFGIYGLIASLIILIFEWPRGKRVKGRTIERRWQRPFSIVVDKLGIAGRNYFIRFVVYLLIVADTLIYGTLPANRVDPDETAPTGAVSSGSTLFANTSNHVTMRMCVPCCFILATVMGGVCLLVTSIIYFLAAMKGEEWHPTYQDETEGDGKKRVKSLHPPKKPPPRLATTKQGDGAGSSRSGAAVSVEGIAMEMTDGARGTGAGLRGQQGGEPTSPVDKKPTRPPPRPRTAARDGIQTVG